jgi:hypothetical protein
MSYSQCVILMIYQHSNLYLEQQGVRAFRGFQYEPKLEDEIESAKAGLLVGYLNQAIEASDAKNPVLSSAIKR